MNVAIYARVSSVAQDVDLSITAQLKALSQYALTNGQTVTGEFVDEARSGRTANRPEFNRMVAQAKSSPPPFEAILVWKMSRFARNREDSVVFKSFLRKRGIQVISINESFDDGPSGRLVEGIIESIDEFYSDNLAQDVVRGMREAASRGFWVSSNTPYGYRRIKVQDGGKERTKLDIDAGAANLINEIFTHAEGGKGSKEIARLLNRNGVASPKGKRWGKSVIHGILTNLVYKGTLVYGKSGRMHGESGFPPVIVDGAVPVIVNPLRFDSLQASITSRAPKIRHPRRVASSYLLSGLIYCGKCGAKMFGHAAKSGRYHYYICGTAERSGKEECGADPVERSRIERQVLRRLLRVILQEPNLERIVELTNEYSRSHAASSVSVAAMFEADLADVRKRLTKLYEALESGEFSFSDLGPRIKRLRTDEDSLVAKLLDARAQAQGHEVRVVETEEVLNHLQDLRQLLDQGSPVQQKEFLASFVKKVTKAGDTVKIEYSLPLPPDHSSLADERVPRIDLSGGPGRVRTCDRSVMSRLLRSDAFCASPSPSPILNLSGFVRKSQTTRPLQSTLVCHQNGRMRGMSQARWYLARRATVPTVFTAS